MYTCVHAKSLQSCPNLYDSIDCAPQASLFTGFSRQEYWSGLSWLPPGIFLTQESNLHLLSLLHWQVDSLPLSPLSPPGKPTTYIYIFFNFYFIYCKNKYLYLYKYISINNLNLVLCIYFKIYVTWNDSETFFFLSNLDFWGFSCWFIFIYIIHCKYSIMYVQKPLIWEAALYGN